MAYDVKISEGKLIYSVPESTSAKFWGVYCIPRMWKMPNGKLVIRFNGREDSPLDTKRAPDLYYVSCDNGESWEFSKDGEKYFDYEAALGIDSPYLKLKNGDWICVRAKDDLKPIENVKHIKQVRHPDGEAIFYVYRYEDIPDECKKIEIVKYKQGKSEEEIIPSKIKFGKREVYVVAFANDGDGNYIEVPKLMRPNIFKNPYICAMKELDDGTLIAAAFGQHPEVSDEYCAAVYLLASTDGGRSWDKRGIIAKDKDELPFGYGGDGASEATLAIGENGDIYCVMRMDMTVNDFFEHPLCDTYFTVSHDSGYTWEKPKSISDSSVTPQIRTLKDGIIFVAYGRPGVHFKISEDGGKTWSDSYSIIGKTLTEERKSGQSDKYFKYIDTSSYSNLYVEKISDDSVLVLYTDLRYDEGDGIKHKAGFVKKITITKK